MSKGNVTFDCIKMHLHSNKLDNIPLQELNKICLNFEQIYRLMDSIFSVFHSELGQTIIDKGTILKKT